MKTIAVIFGGQSTEHDVSIVTAIASIIKPLRALGLYQVEPVYIAKDGSWYWDEALADIQLFSSGRITEWLRKAPKTAVLFDGGLQLVKSTGLTGRKLYRQIDVAFPATHGTNGEDGSLMGLLRLAGVPFVGCDMEASVLAMNKLLAHAICASAGIPHHRYAGLTKAEFSHDPKGAMDQLEQALSYPMFTKPVHLGSSIGISRVTSRAELSNALEVVFHYDQWGIVEEAVPNLVEVTVPIMGNHELTLGVPEEPALSGEEFFDFDKKYLGMGKKGSGKVGGAVYSHLPARLPDALLEQCRQVATSVYQALGCTGISRVDLLVDAKAGIVYFNEVNPLPGSLYLHNWRAAGFSAAEVVGRLVDLAVERHAESGSLTTGFTTNFLKQF